MKYENSPKAKEQEELLEEYLERIQGIVNHMSSRLVVMYIPDVSQLHHPEMQHITQVLERLCLQRDIPFIDMTPVFEEAEDPAAFYLWPRDAHTNARGHRRMAEALYGSLCHLGILEGLDCGGTQRPVADVAFLN